MKTITVKQTGQNMTVVIEGETLVKRIDDKEVREGIKAKVIAYNAKNNANVVKELKKLFAKSDVKTEKRAKAKVATEKVEKLKEEATKTVADVVKDVAVSKISQEEIERLEKDVADAQKRLNDAKGIAPKPVEHVAQPRRGEH